MRKAILLLTCVLFSLSAFAQRGGQHVSHNEGHVFTAPRGGGYNVHNYTAPRNEERFHQLNAYRGYHYGAPAGELRTHWIGNRFDNAYWGSHWGPAHPFYLNHCYWSGRPFWPGSYFWYGGIYFVIVDEVPDYFYNDGSTVYVDYIDGYGYALVNPVYPNVYVRIRVQF